MESIEGDAMSTGTHTAQQAPPAASDVAHEVSVWAVGGGIVTTALFPLAIPILGLTAVALLPLLAPVVALGLAAALVALPVLAVRAVARAVSRRHPSVRRPEAAGRAR
jgi:membrane protein implicated in regulation of membrane protease activity